MYILCFCVCELNDSSYYIHSVTKRVEKVRVRQCFLKQLACPLSMHSEGCPVD